MVSGEDDFQHRRATEIQHLPQVMVNPVTAPSDKGVYRVDVIMRKRVLTFYVMVCCCCFVVVLMPWTAVGKVLGVLAILIPMVFYTLIFININMRTRGAKLEREYVEYMRLWQGAGATLPSGWNDASPSPAPPASPPSSLPSPPPPPSTPPPFSAQPRATDQSAAGLGEEKVADEGTFPPQDGQLPESPNEAGSGQPPQDQHMGTQPPTNHHSQEGGVPQQTPAARQEAETTGATGPASQPGEETGQSPRPTIFSAQYESQEHHMDVYLNTLDAREALTRVERDDPLAVGLFVSRIVVEFEIRVNNENLHKLGRRAQLKRGEKLQARLNALVRWLSHD